MTPVWTADDEGWDDDSLWWDEVDEDDDAAPDKD